MAGPLRKALFLAAGHAFLALGIVGVFLPLLPTTPFLLLAAACYARGSERWAQWLAAHPRLGPPLAAWRSHGAIPPRAKGAALAMMALSVAMIHLNPRIPEAARWLATALIVAAAAFVASRPNGPGRMPSP